MTYGEMINKIMPLVKDNGALPFIISRNGGEWELDYLGLAPEKAAQHLAVLREKDPCAVQFTGADFARGSFPYVYDAVLCQRLREEYSVARSSGRDTDELNALTQFLIDNIGEFSSEVTDYLTELDRPLAALNRMDIPILANGADGYDEDKAQAAIDVIENRVAELSSRKNEEITDNMVEKRNIEGYIEKISVNLAGKTVVLAENPKAAEPYLVCDIKYDNPLGIEERCEGAVTDNYTEAVLEFTKRVDALAGALEAERKQRGLPFVPLTAADCVPNGLDDDITGKLIIIKPEALAPEYRAADRQLKICVGGFGSKPNSRGNAVFCKDLYSGKESRFEWYDVLGIADMERLPEWAKVKLAVVEAVKEPDVFEYGGYHFKPLRKFAEGETGRQAPNDSRPWKNDARYAMRNMHTDTEIGKSNDEWQKADYSHDKFYAASGGSDADIFKCVENGRLYVPGANELFHYTEPPVYSQAASKSFAQLHKECADAIDAAVSEVRTPGKMAGTATYDFSTALDKLNDRFGKACVTEVLAAIVMKNDYDGRYSQKNKAWAKGFNAAEIEDVRHSIRYQTVNTHPSVLDGFVSHARESMDKKPSLHDRLEAAKETAREADKNNNRGTKTKKRNDREV